MAEEIIIYSGDTTSQELELSDYGHTRVKRGKDIKWEITEDKTNVVAIEDIQKKDGDDIFSQLPIKENSKKWKAKVKDKAADYDRYEYSIKWKASNGNTYTHDPIISIKPSTSPDVFKALILLGAAALGFYTLKFLLLKKRRKATHKTFPSTSESMP